MCRLKVFAPCCLLLSLVAAACSKDPKAYFESGNRYFDQKKYAEAIVEYRNAIQQDPRFGAARFQLAEAYVRVNDPQRAFREYVRAADLLPSQVDAQVKAGVVLAVAGRYEDAKSRATKALALDPRNVDAQILLGNATAGLKDLSGAVAQIQEAIQLDPQRAGAYSNLGAIELVRGNRLEAENAFKKAIDVDPRSAKAHLALANFYWSVGRRAEAEASLKASAALDSGGTTANHALAMFYIASGRAAEAEPYLKAMAKAGGGPSARLLLADYYIQMQRPVDARAVLTPMAQEKGSSAAANTRLAALEYAAGRQPAAHALIDLVIRQEPNNVPALNMKGRFLVAERKLDEALAQFNTAASADPRSVEAQYALGTIYASKNEPDNAARAFSEVLKLNPRAVAAQIQLSRLNLGKGDVTASLQFSEEAVKIQPANPDARLALARSLMAKGDLSRAEAEMKRLAEDFPSAAAVHALMARFHLLKKDQVAARRSYERAQALDPASLDALTGLVTLDAAAGLTAEARRRVDAQLAKRPDDSALLVLAARTYAADHDAGAAERALRKAIDVDPANLQAYAMLGRFYLGERKLDQAAAEFEALTRRQPKSVPAHTMIAMILQVQNKTVDAQRKYEQVLAIDPRAAVAANNLAWIYSETGGNLDLALQLAQTASERLPDRPEVNDTLGWICYKKDLIPQAISVLERSVERDANNPAYRYHLGMAYVKAGNWDKGRRALSEALALKSDFAGSAQARKTLASLGG